MSSSQKECEAAHRQVVDLANAATKDSITILTSLPEVLTLEQAASTLQIGITTARGMCRERKLPAVKVGTQWRIPKAWLCQFMQGGGNNE